VTLHLPDIERVSEFVHSDWVNKKLAEGVTSRMATWGEELVARTESYLTRRNNWIATP
jgi:hypothetical protein